MKTNTLYTITAVYLLLFGVVSLLIPTPILRLLYSTDPGAAGVWQTRLAGAVWVGLGLIVWMGRNAESPLAHRAISTGLVLFFALDAIVDVLAALSSLGPPVMWWVGAIVHTLFAAAWGLVGLGRRATT